MDEGQREKETKRIICPWGSGWLEGVQGDAIGLAPLCPSLFTMTDFNI